MSKASVTSAASSGVRVPPRALKSLLARSDRPGLIYLGLNLLLSAACGALVWLAQGSWWLAPAIFLFGGVTMTWVYALSHECSHKTAFKTPWLNQAFFWLTSVIYLESPTHRTYAHLAHHTHTWINGADAQMPYGTPLTPWGWFLEISGIGFLIYEVKLHLQLAAGHISDEVAGYLPEANRPAAIREARIILAIYVGLIVLAVTIAPWIWTFVLLPKLAGGLLMQIYTIIQHAELVEDQTDLRNSTRSFTTNALGRLLYWEMNHHLEHHLYPIVPFHRLADLHRELHDDLPAPDKGLWRSNGKVLDAVLRRTLRRGQAAEAA